MINGHVVTPPNATQHVNLRRLTDGPRHTSGHHGVNLGLNILPGQQVEDEG